MASFRVGQKVIYNPHKGSVHHVGIIVVVDEFIHVHFEIGSDLFFPLDGYDKLFDRQLTVVDKNYTV